MTSCLASDVIKLLFGCYRKKLFGCYKKIPCENCNFHSNCFTR